MKTNMTLTEQKQEGVYILNEIKRVCTILNIKYYLAFGTLLGAIRHKGFIPWDDDVDLWMLREDYELFIRKFNSLCSDNFKFISWHEDESYPFMVGKVVSQRTYVEEKCFKPRKELGIWVDIFPLDYVSEKNTPAFIREEEKLEHRRWVALYYDSTIFAKIKLFFYNLIQKDTTFSDRKIKPSFFMNKLYEINYNTDKSEQLVCPGSDYDYSRFFESKDFEKTIEADFEDEKFSIPAGYDNILIKYYGDYMKLPSKAKQKFDKHLRKAIWR